MLVSIRSNIVESMKAQTLTNNKSKLTLMSQPEWITQDLPHPTPQVTDLNNLIGEMDIENIPHKRKIPPPSNKTENQNENQIERNNTTFESATKTRAASRNSRLNKFLQKGHKQS